MISAGVALLTAASAFLLLKIRNFVIFTTSPIIQAGIRIAFYTLKANQMQVKRRVCWVMYCTVILLCAGYKMHLPATQLSALKKVVSILNRKRRWSLLRPARLNLKALLKQMPDLSFQ